MLEAWDKWLEGHPAADSTKKLYTRKLKCIFKDLEREMKDFFVDSLLFPLENEMMFPSLNVYLSMQEHNNSNDKLTAIKTYEWFCDLVIYLFNKRYSSNKDFTIEKKNTFLYGVTVARQVQSRKL